MYVDELGVYAESRTENYGNGAIGPLLVVGPACWMLVAELVAGLWSLLRMRGEAKRGGGRGWAADMT